jgi:rod shape-determining protein MreB and related proteins
VGGLAVPRGANRRRTKDVVLFGRDIAIDLGTANTLVCVQGQDVVLSDPSVVALDTRTDEVLAVGSAAKRMIGRTPANIVAVEPLKEGVIADFGVTEKMIAHFVRRVHRRGRRRSPGRSLFGPRVVVCAPSGATDVELRAVREAAEAAGARRAYTIEEPLAAAIGAGLPVEEPEGSMVVDVGGGTTEVAVISLGGIVTKASVRVAGNEMDGAIASFVQREHKMAVGMQTAERLKIELGSALPLEGEESAEVRGRNLESGLPKTVFVTSEDIREAIRLPVEAIVGAVKDTLDRTQPELAADIVERGMVLAGGGALLRNLDERLRRETGVPVHVAEDPLGCVAVGAGRYLETLGHLGIALSSALGRGIARGDRVSVEQNVPAERIDRSAANP